MRRRTALASIAALLAARGAHGQERVRIAFISGGPPEPLAAWLADFKDELGRLGFPVGARLEFSARFALGKFDRLPGLVAEILRENPAVIVSATTPASLAVKAATTSIPIVIMSVADPVGVGLVDNLARPSGNITGITNILAELTGKRLQVLKELVPQLSKVAIFVNPGDSNAAIQIRNAESASRGIGVTLHPIASVSAASDLEPAFQSAIAAGAQAILRLVDPLTTALTPQSIELAARHRLTFMHPFREAVKQGGLVAYSANQSAQYRRAAHFVARILQGAKPADLPVERPTKFELAINLKTAHALGLAIPPSVLAQADEVFE